MDNCLSPSNKFIYLEINDQQTSLWGFNDLLGLVQVSDPYSRVAPNLLCCINRVSNTLFRQDFEEKEQISLAMMDKGGKKKGKGDFAEKALETDKVRDMDLHKISFEELEQRFDTNLADVSD